ncbi:hypothetical protein GGH94_005160 [Coemansia aciculifera]|uniref:WD40 repeat-like protein n=1 Tax=Coemansia aciculifera TaxID=417176 RepID=A0A9W8IKJ6_9FUNG|nr:hypothetical protein GGH94_005160 [Coemansia aciculifera]
MCPKSEICPLPKRRRVVVSSDSGSDSEPSSADSMMDILLASQDRGPQHIEKLQAAYKKHRRLYLKHTKLAAKAADAMHLATRMLARALNAQPSSGGDSSASVSQSPSAQRQAPVPAHSGADEHIYESDGASNCSVKSEQHTMGSSSETCIASGTVPPTSRSIVNTLDRGTMSTSSAVRKLPGPSDEKALMASNNAVRAYQFSTRRHKAFQLKPRAAFTCSVGGEAEQKVVAYGMDGAVQIWNPHTQVSEASLTRTDLGIEYLEDMAQISSNILAGVPKVVSGDSRASSMPDIVFIGLSPPLANDRSKAAMKAQSLVQSPHEGQISVVSGMGYSPQRHSSRAFLLTGGTKDKDVYMWSLETYGARVVKTLATQKMRSGHTTRITALCHEPISNSVIAGAANGRVSVNDVESGKLLMSSGQLSQCAIGSTTLCPTNTNVLLTSCASKSEQVRIYDLRQGISWAKPAIMLGVKTPRTQSRYSRSAWHPDGGLVMYPFRGGTSESPEDGLVAIWDTRYAQCDAEEPQLFSPHSDTVWSICFTEAHGSRKPTMVTVSSDHCLGFTTFAT